MSFDEKIAEFKKLADDIVRERPIIRGRKFKNQLIDIDFKSYDTGSSLFQLEWYVILCYYKLLPHPNRIHVTNYIISQKKLQPWVTYKPENILPLCDKRNRKIKEARDNEKQNIPTPGKHCTYCAGKHLKLCNVWVNNAHKKY